MAPATPPATGGQTPAKADGANPHVDMSEADDARLPLEIVQRQSEAISRKGQDPIWRRLWRIVSFVPLVMLIVATGGFIGLYFQPPGLQKLMLLLHLEPGGGTSHPIAVPVGRDESASNNKKAARLDQQEPFAPASPGMIVGLGKLLPEGDVTNIAPPFGAGDARITTFKVKEGDRVEKGAVLAVLDNERGLLSAVEAARANAAAREASLRQMRASTLASRDEARATMARAESAVVSARRDLDRVRELRAKGFAADATYDPKLAAFDQAVQDVAKARATLQRYEFESIDKQLDVQVAARTLDSANADLERAKADLDKAYVLAPSSGTVLTIHLRAGEKPGSAGIMNFGNIDVMTAEIEIYQSQIGFVDIGAAVSVSADALSAPLNGSVTRIGLEVARQTVTDTSPAANTDARTVKVYVTLEPASVEIARRYTNLQVTARIARKLGP